MINDDNNDDNDDDDSGDTKMRNDDDDDYDVMMTMSLCPLKWLFYPFSPSFLHHRYHLPWKQRMSDSSANCQLKLEGAIMKWGWHVVTLAMRGYYEQVM